MFVDFGMKFDCSLQILSESNSEVLWSIILQTSYRVDVRDLWWPVVYPVGPGVQLLGLFWTVIRFCTPMGQPVFGSVSSQATPLRRRTDCCPVCVREARCAVTGVLTLGLPRPRPAHGLCHGFISQATYLSLPSRN